MRRPVCPLSSRGDNIHMVAFTMLGSLLGLAALLLIDRKVRKAI